MITDDEVMRLFERADPARLNDVTPTIDSWGYLDALITRSNDMTITESETTTQPEPTKPPRWSMIALAAAAVVAIVGGGIALASRDEPTQPVTNQPVAVGAGRSSRLRRRSMSPEASSRRSAHSTPTRR